jgi:hypothetical protein
LFVGLINLVRPTYGVHFLQGISSVYPWFHASRSFADVVIGTIDGLIDGAIAGLLFGWLYNLSVGNRKGSLKLGLCLSSFRLVPDQIRGSRVVVSVDEAVVRLQPQ